MIKELYTNYHIKIKPLSPIHIGSGKEYYPYEYVPSIESEKLIIFNLNQFTISNPKEATQSILNKGITPLWKIIDKNHLINKNFILNFNSISKSTASKIKDSAEKGNAATIWEFIKNEQNEPYIPGSSLKGVFRTAIAYYLIKSNTEVFSQIKNELPKNLDVIENRVFRENNDLKKDLMRLWTFSDSKPLNKHKTLSVVKSCRLSKSDFLGFYNYYEVLSESSPELESDIHFSNYLTETDLWQTELRNIFPKTLDEVLKCLNCFVDDIISWELNYYQNHHNSIQLGGLIKFYQNLKNLRANSISLIPLGKGTGWIRKTVGLLLREKEKELFKLIFDKNKLGRKGQNPNTFPTSREIVREEKNTVFGWARITI